MPDYEEGRHCHPIPPSVTVKCNISQCDFIAVCVCYHKSDLQTSELEEIVLKNA